MALVQDELHALLLKRHGKEDFNIRNMADTIASANETQNTLTYLLAAVAGVSLVVGGIGATADWIATVMGGKTPYLARKCSPWMRATGRNRRPMPDHSG